MPAYEDALDSIVATIADYHTTPDRAHVARWIEQFPDAVQLPILQELGHVLKKTYWPKTKIVSWLTDLAANTDMVGADPKTYWSGVRFLRLQQAGNSQKDMLALFAEILLKQYGLALDTCGQAAPHTYLYLDDFLFSGGRIRNDVGQWISGDAPQMAKLDIVVIGFHRYGQWYVNGELEKVRAKVAKDITVSWRRSVEIENGPANRNGSDVLWPKAIPADPATQAYVAELQFPPTLRSGNAIGPARFFSPGGLGREVLEQQFLIQGVDIRSRAPLLNKYQRPLGNMVLQTLGFGAMTVTYRNCPNNAPLVLWAGDPWYPLFARKTN